MEEAPRPFPGSTVPGVALSSDEYKQRAEACSAVFTGICSLAGASNDPEFAVVRSVIEEALGSGSADTWTCHAQLRAAELMGEGATDVLGVVLVDSLFSDCADERFQEAVHLLRSVVEARREAQRLCVPGVDAQQAAAGVSDDDSEFYSPREPPPPDQSTKLIDPVILGSIEADATELSAGLSALFGEASMHLHRACGLCRQCSMCFGVSADKLCASVHAAEQASNGLFATCDDLERSFDAIDATAARIKELRAGVVQLEGLLGRAKSLQ
eukprot:TRINITY_DN17327_c0_g1_i1.p1 TRINITY_DN17327_c0_g1~~TRINITY_DN17327_c0_g1_i1.p1  ORF type:complete len:270 (+),score=61.69 TRINITY_DN17327_c0_g1_i1:100-909(+)